MAWYGDTVRLQKLVRQYNNDISMQQRQSIRRDKNDISIQRQQYDVQRWQMRWPAASKVRILGQRFCPVQMYPKTVNAYGGVQADMPMEARWVIDAYGGDSSSYAYGGNKSGGQPRQMIEFLGGAFARGQMYSKIRPKDAYGGERYLHFWRWLAQCCPIFHFVKILLCCKEHVV